MAISINKTSTPEPDAGKASGWLAGLSFEKTISARERKFFTEQMALLLETGTSIQASLLALKKQLDNPAMITLVEQITDDIEQGRQFSSALARHPQVFSATYVNLIAASEDGGFMHQVLEQLLALDDKREELRQTVSSALSYPIFLLFFAFAVVIFVLVVVFPKFSDLFTQIKDQLPWTTVGLMATSEFIKQHWVASLASIAVAVGAFQVWARTEKGAYRLDWLKLNTPLLRNVFIQMYMVQSLRVLSLSLSNGVGMMDSLKACKHVVANRLFRDFISHVEDQVESGNGVAVGFSNTGFIPPIVEQMMHTGEETGNLPRVLSRLSDYFENELSNRLKTLSRLAEPIMLLVMGGVVGVIVSSLILPIFKLSRAVG